MSDRGTPRSWRHMHMFGSHTFMWTNLEGSSFWVKYHFTTEQGIANFTSAEARAVAGDDPDHHLRDLHRAIANGDHPSWRMEMQIMPVGEAGEYRFNPFDVTKVWPHADYPLIMIGRLVLDRNPVNHFAEVEQAAFEPSNMVPGIGPSPDKMLLARMMSYPDAHRHRIGTNYAQLPINRPATAVHSYSKDGAMRLDHNGDRVVYAPNSFGGPEADVERAFEPGWFTSGDIGRFPSAAHPADDDFGQARSLWEDVLTDGERDHLVANVVEHLGNGVDDPIVRRALRYWDSVAPDLGARISAGMGTQ
jgi:catalase